MNVADLVHQDSLNLNPKEWEAVLGRPGTAGGVQMQFVTGQVHPNGSIWMKFAFVATFEVEFVGVRVTRRWREGNAVRTKIVREDQWIKPILFNVGDAIAVEPIVFPEDFE